MDLQLSPICTLATFAVIYIIEIILDNIKWCVLLMVTLVIDPSLIIS